MAVPNNSKKQITYINEDGVTIVEDFQFVEFNYSPTSPLIPNRSEPLVSVCPYCGRMGSKIFMEEITCCNCNVQMVDMVGYSEDDDIINNRFEILDL